MQCLILVSLHPPSSLGRVLVDQSGERLVLTLVGFIAVAFASNSLAIVDMRGPDVILREGFDSEGVTMKKKQKKGNVQNVPGEVSPVGSMKWVVAGLGAGELA